MYIANAWFLFLGIVQFFGLIKGYEFQCPHYSTWHLRSEKICNTTEKYYCLHDDNKRKYREFCKSSYDVERVGAFVVVLFVKGNETYNENPLLSEKNDQLRYFCWTAASKEIRQKVYDNQCTLITGPPGCGKTAIAFSIAFELRTTDGYTIIPVSLPNDLSKLKKARSFRYQKHVLILDSVIGIDTLSSCNTIDLHYAIKTALSKVSSLKIIMTCRSHVYSMNTFVDDYFYHCDMLLGSMELSLKERKEILSRYHDDDFINQIGHDDLAQYNFFPAICALSLQTENKSPAVFAYPFDFFKIEYMRNQYDILYSVIALMIVNSGKVEKKLLDEENNGSDQMLNDIFSESGFKPPPSKLLLKRILKSLNGTLLEETDSCFAFLHDNLFQVVSTIVGSVFVSSIIKHGNISFIQKRLQLTSLNEQFDRFTIPVRPQLETLFFDRLLCDLRKGYVWSSLRNFQLQYSQFRQNLIIRLKKYQELKHVKDVADDSSVLHVTSHVGYYDLFSHFMRNDQPKINQTNKNGRTALHVACEKKRYKIAKSLILNGANINVMDVDSRTALHLACESGNHKIIELLVQHKAEINIPDCNGLTPLHIACSEGHFVVVNLLLQNNANVDVTDRLNRTCYIIACEKENKHKEKGKQIIELLLKYKGYVNCAP